jgi:hypothetical protein
MEANKEKQMSDVYDFMNRTELLQILASDKYGNLRLRHSVATDRLAHLVKTGEKPAPEEIVSETRRKLQLWIERNSAQIASQLPCTGPNKGKCTIYPCSEGKHLDCHLAAVKYML